MAVLIYNWWFLFIKAAFDGSVLQEFRIVSGSAAIIEEIISKYIKICVN